MPAPKLVKRIVSEGLDLAYEIQGKSARNHNDEKLDLLIRRLHVLSHWCNGVGDIKKQYLNLHRKDIESWED